MKFKPPFVPNNEQVITQVAELIFGGGFGRSQSSATSIGTITPARAMGQAKVGIFANLTNGNLYIEDHSVEVIDGCWSHRLGLVYNSLDKPSWRINLGRRLYLKKIRGYFSDTQMLLMTDDDGAEILFGPASQSSFVAKTAKGNYELTKLPDGTYTLLHPGSGVSSKFNKAGFEVSRLNAAGNGINFNYTEDEALQSIILPSERIIQFSRKENTLDVSLHDATGALQQTLLSCTFNANAQLTKTSVKLNATDVYTTKYQYASDQSLQSIEQSDSTKVSFKYSIFNSKSAVFEITDGENRTLHFTYSGSNRTWQLGDDANNCFKAKVFSSGNLNVLSKPKLTAQSSGGVSLQYLSTTYKYKDGRISSVQYAGGTGKSFTYDNKTGLEACVTISTGEKKESFYDASRGVLLAKRQNAVVAGVAQDIVEYYIYDEHRQCRYHISAGGQVTRYDWDVSRSLCMSERTQLNSAFDLSSYSVSSTPALGDLDIWWGDSSKNDITQSTLKVYDYNSDGLLVGTTQYAEVAANGNGIETDAVKRVAYPVLCPTGKWLHKTEQLSQSKSALVRRMFDGLFRVVSYKDALEREIVTVYDDATAKIEVTYPSGLVEHTQYDASGLVLSKEKQSAERSDKEVYHRDAKTGAIYRTVNPRGVFNTYYTASGYLLTIDDEQLLKVQLIYGDRDHLIGILELKLASSNNPSRLNSILRDASGRIAFEIDGDGYVLGYQYDNANRLIATVKYATPLDPMTPRVILPNNTLSGLESSVNDRKTIHYNSADGHTIGEHDPAGFVTQYLCNLSGWRKETTRFETPQVRKSSWNDLLNLVKDDKCYRAVQELDLLGNHVSVVDNENHKTQFTWLGNGRWGTKSCEGHTETRCFDLANHLLSLEEAPFGRLTKYQYDLHDEVSDKSITDTQSKTVVYHTQIERNAFGQVTLEKGPRKHEQNQYLYDTETGLKMRRIDSLGHQTIIFEDNRKRVVAEIDPNGAVVLTDYNEFGDVQTRRKMMTLLADADRASLNGGLINAAAMELMLNFINDSIDRVTTYVYNRRGLETTVTDPDHFQIRQSYNAFHELLLKVEDIDRKSQVRVTQYQYSYYPEGKPGRRKVTIKDPADPKINPKGFNLTTTAIIGVLGAPVQVQHPNGHIDSYTYDSYARKITHTDHALNATELWKKDAFGRNRSHVDFQGRELEILYNDTARSVTHISPLKKSRVTIQSVLGVDEHFIHPDKSEYFHLHNPAGDLIKEVDELNRATLTTINPRGDILHKDYPNGLQHSLKTNPGGAVTFQHEKADDLVLTTGYDPNAVGEPQVKTDAKSDVTRYTRNRRGLETCEETVLSTHTQGVSRQYNGLRGLISETRYDGTQSFLVSYMRDALGRKIAEINDPITTDKPNALNLSTNYYFDAHSNVIRVVDPRKKTNWHVYNQRDQECFHITAMGIVHEYFYDAYDKLGHRIYAKTIDVSKLPPAPTPSDIGAMVSLSADDVLTYYFYDDDRKHIFTVSGLGVVTENLYDINDRHQGTCTYAKKIDMSAVRPGELMSVRGQVKSSPLEDRIDLKIFNAVGKPRFYINARGMVTEHVLDAADNPVKVLRYATPLDLSLPMVWTEANVIDLLDANNANNRVVYQVFDTFNRLRFLVDEALYVTGYDYDKVHNQIGICVYEKPLDALLVPLTIAAIEAEVDPKNPNNRVTLKAFDALKRKIAQTVAKDPKENWGFDALNHIRVYWDQKGYTWLTNYDDAGRKTDDLTPETNVYELQHVANPDVPLGIQIVVNSIVKDRKIKHRVLDAAGNLSAISVGRSLDPSGYRSVLYDTDDDGRTSAITSKSVEVDNPSLHPVKPGDMVTEQRDVVRQFVYNHANNVLVAMNESGAGHFKVYDADQHLNYEVLPNGAVRAYERNAFGETIQVTQYATAINLTLSNYLSKGLTISDVEADGVLVSSPLDRVITFAYSQTAKKTQTAQPAQLMAWVADNTLNWSEKYGPMTQLFYDGFDEKIGSKQFINAISPTESNWKYSYEWFDIRGDAVIKARSVDGLVFNVKAYQYNHLHKPKSEREFDHQFIFSDFFEADGTPKDIAVVTACITQQQDPHADVCHDYFYDGKGRCVERRLLKETVHEVIRSKKASGPAIHAKSKTITVPTDLASHEQDLSHQFAEFDPRNDKPTLITSPNGQQTAVIYDELGREQFHREPFADLNNPDAFSGLVAATRQSGYDAFSDKAVYSSKGYVLSDPEGRLIHGVSATPSADTFQVDDMRGLPVAKQDANGHIQWSSYTANRLLARHYWFRGIYGDNPKYMKPTPTVMNAIRTMVGWPVSSLQSTERYTATLKPMERAFQYDANSNVIFKLEINYDGEKQPLYMRYNLFDESIALGDDPALLSKPRQAWPQHRWMSRLGHPLLDIGHDGAQRLFLFDGLGKQVLQLQKPHDATLFQQLTPVGGTESDIDESGVMKLLEAIKNKKWDSGNYQLTMWLYDHYGEVMKKYHPKLSVQKPRTPSPFYTAFEVRNHPNKLGYICLVWRRPEAGYLKGEIALTLSHSAAKTQHITAQDLGDGVHDYIDITELVSGYYDYVLTYTFDYSRYDIGQLSENIIFTKSCQGKGNDALPITTRFNIESIGPVARIDRFNMLLVGGKIDSSMDFSIKADVEGAASIPITLRPGLGVFKTADLSQYVMGRYLVLVNGKALPGRHEVVTTNMPKPGDVRSVEVVVPEITMTCAAEFDMDKKKKHGHTKEGRTMRLYATQVSLDPGTEQTPFLSAQSQPHLLVASSSYNTVKGPEIDPVPLPYKGNTRLYVKGEGELPALPNEKENFYKATAIDNIDICVTISGEQIILSSGLPDTDNKGQPIDTGSGSSITRKWTQTATTSGECVLFAGLPEGVQAFDFEYLDYTLAAGGDEIHTRDRWRNMSTRCTLSPNGQFFVFDSKGIPTGVYEYKLYLYADKAKQELILLVDDHFCLTHGANATPVPKQTEIFVPKLPTEIQVRDSHRHVVSHTDRLDHTTDYVHNRRGKTIKKVSPEIAYLDDDNVTVRHARPLHETGYDGNGYHVGDKDANGHVTDVIRNAAGDAVSKADADGVYQNFALDGFKNVVQVTDDSGLVGKRVYDLMQRLRSETDRHGNTTLFDRDEAGHVSHRQTPEGFEFYTNHDIRGYVIETANARGQKVAITVDRHGQVLALHDGIAASGVEIPVQNFRDFFGHFDESKPYQITDRSGTQYKVTLNNNKVEVSRVADFGTDPERHGMDINPVDGTDRPTPPQNLRYILDEADNIIYVLDDGRGATDQLHYNAASECIAERFSDAHGMVYQDTHIVTNAMGWIVTMLDDAVLGEYQYDRKGNRRHTQVHLTPVSNDLEWTVDGFFSYSDGDRVHFDDAKLSAQGKIEIGLDDNGHPKGRIIMYDLAGREISEKRKDKKDVHDHGTVDVHTLSINITYNDAPDSMVWHVTQVDNAKPGEVVQLAQYTLTKAGNLKQKLTYDYVQNKIYQTDYQLFEGSDAIHSVVSTVKDLMTGQVISETKKKKKPDTMEQQFDMPAVDGFAAGSKQYVPNASKPSQMDEVVTDFVYFLARKIQKNTDSNSKKDNDGNWHLMSTTTAQDYFDANGEFSCHTANTTDEDGVRAAITNSEGRIIMVRDGKGYKDSKGNFEYYFYDPRTKTPMGQYGNIPPGFRQRGELVDAPPFKDINFNQGFHSLDRFVPPPIPGMYTPPYRQTFNQIAEAVYGSKRYGDDLAVRNGGGSGSAVVYANDSIYLPAKNTMSYNSVQDTAIVAENSKIGSLNPNIPQLLPPVHHHIWVEILDAYFLLTAVVLDIVSGGSGTPFLVAMIEQVAVAVVTNLETQAVNMIGGVQHKFNGTSLALSAVEAAISAGAGEVSKLQAGPNMIHYKFGAQLAISESFEALRQVAAIGFGAQHHFNWAGFVASALGASTGGIMHKAHLSKAEGYALQTASAGVQVVIEGLGTKSHRVDPFTVGATMLGTAIGTAIASPSASPRADINTTNKSANGNLSRSMPTTHQDESPLELAYDAGEQGPVDLKGLHTESTSPAVHQAKNDARMHGTYLDQVQQSEINAFRHLMWSHSQDIMTHLDAMSLDMLGAKMSVGGSLGVSASVASSTVKAQPVHMFPEQIYDKHTGKFLGWSKPHVIEKAHRTGFGGFLDGHPVLHSQLLEGEYSFDKAFSAIVNSPEGGAVHALETAAAGAGAVLVKSGVLAKVGVFAAGVVGRIKKDDSSVGLTSRLSKGEIKEYFSRIGEVSREQLLTDLKSLGLKLKGEGRDGEFMEFIDKQGRVKVKIHPPDRRTPYSHIHVYDKAGRPLNIKLQIVSRRSEDAHIEVKPLNDLENDRGPAC